MRKILVLIAAVALFACSQQKGYKIKVELEGADGKVLLEKRGESSMIPVDTAEIVDGVAVFEGEVPFPQDYYLSVVGQRPKTIIFVENANMTITGKADSLQKVTVTGSETHSEYKELESQIRGISDEYMAMYQQSRQAAAEGDTAKAEELMEKVNELYESTNTIQKDFVRNHPGSYISPVILTNLQAVLEFEELDSLVSSLEPKLDSLVVIKNLKERLEQLRTVAVGQTAPDFTMNDPEGNPVKFSDIYSQNELTLLDFWAGWCGPCRQENPNVVAVYNDFKDEGFGVFGVSLDRTREDWLKAIESDKLTWPHVSDLSYWNNSAAKLYAVNSIPSNLLVDKNGKIVAKNKRGEELRETVSQILD